MRHDSLWLFLPNNLTRRLLFIISMHKYYRIACAVSTVVACAVYAAEPAGDDPLSVRAGELSYVDMLINLFFGYELGIKARCMIVGMLAHPLAHIRAPRSWLSAAGSCTPAACCAHFPAGSSSPPSPAASLAPSARRASCARCAASGASRGAGTCGPCF